MHSNSKLLFEAYAKGHFKNGMRVLEIGPDAFPSTFQNGVNNDTIVWETLDIYDNPNLTHRAVDEYTFPIKDNTYDVVFSANVIEHVRRVWIWIREIARVCKPGGYVITITPVSWPYHEAPIDCWRIYPEAMRSLYNEAGLCIKMASFGSLEPQSKLDIPGRSQEWVRWKNPSAKANNGLTRLLGRCGLTWRKRQKLKWAIRSFLYRRIGVQTERAYDTIAIGTKELGEVGRNSSVRK